MSLSAKTTILPIIQLHIFLLSSFFFQALMANSVRPHFTITLDLKLVRGHHVDLTLKNVLFLILEIYICIYIYISKDINNNNNITWTWSYIYMWQYTGKKLVFAHFKKAIQYFLSLPKLIREISFFWNSIFSKSS